MSDAVTAIAAVSRLRAEALEPAAITAPAASAGASDWLAQQLQQTDVKIKSADVAVQQLAAGRDVELHRVMLDIEQARVSFDLMVQVRNRLVEAYQDIVRMQV